MDDLPSSPEPANLRLLRRLVTVLTATMIVGIAAIVILLALRLTDDAPLALPDRIDLPDGARAAGITFTDGLVAVVTTDGRILIYDPTGTDLRRTIEIE